MPLVVVRKRENMFTLQAKSEIRKYVIWKSLTLLHRLTLLKHN